MPKFVLNKTGRTQLIGVAGKRRAGPLLDEFDDGDAWLERVVIRIERGEVIGGERAPFGEPVDVSRVLSEIRNDLDRARRDREIADKYRNSLNVEIEARRKKNAAALVAARQRFDNERRAREAAEATEARAIRDKAIRLENRRGREAYARAAESARNTPPSKCAECIRRDEYRLGRCQFHRQE